MTWFKPIGWLGESMKLSHRRHKKSKGLMKQGGSRIMPSDGGNNRWTFGLAKRNSIYGEPFSYQDKKLLGSLHKKFIVQINSLLDSTLDHGRGTTVRDEAKEFMSGLLDFAKAKLAKSGLEVEQIAAQISKTFAERQTELAKAEKTSEETRELRIQNDIAELRFALGATKAMLVGDNSEEAVLFGKQIDAFLEVLRDIAGTSI